MPAHLDPQTATCVAVFAVVYLGIILGALPFLKLDRTGIALLGAIALVGTEVLPLTEAWEAIHVPTLILLFAFMVVSAQLRMGGFYTWVTCKIGAQQIRGVYQGGRRSSADQSDGDLGVRRLALGRPPGDWC
ncbi:MAG: SLC13 family permease [Burkholderiales bacterium]